MGGGGGGMSYCAAAMALCHTCFGRKTASIIREKQISCESITRILNLLL